MATPQRAPLVAGHEDPHKLQEPQEAQPHDHPTFEEVAAEAYAIYMANGAGHGNDVNDWLEAERRLRTR